METYIAFVTIGGMPLSGEHERRLLTAIEEIKGHPGSGLKVIDVHNGGVMVVMTDQRPKETSANLSATLTRLLGEGVDVAIHRYDMVQTFIGDLEEKTDKWLEAAHSLAANGKHERALIYFEKCLTNDPENLSAMQGKARSLLVLGRVDMAVALLTKILKQDPDRPSVWKDLGMGLAGQGKHKEAVKAFDKAIVKGTASEEAGEGELKDIAELLLLKGACLRALGKFD